jgi:hypothetical protein
VIPADHRCRDWAVRHEWDRRARRSSVRRGANRGIPRQLHRDETWGHRDVRAGHRDVRSSVVGHRDPMVDQWRRRASGVERQEVAGSADRSNSVVDRGAAGSADRFD